MSQLLKRKILYTYIAVSSFIGFSVMAEQSISSISPLTSSNGYYSPQNNTANNQQTDPSLFLEDSLKQIQDKQGFLGKTYDSAKSILGFGTSYKDCENVIAGFKNGQISYDDAIKKINDYNSSQESGANLLSNIITGVGAIGLATFKVKGGHINWGTALKLGAPTGAALKTGIKIADRSSNNIQGDELDGKQILKDAVSGTTSAVSSNIGVGIAKRNVDVSIKNGIECGVLCGALSGSTNYVTDYLFDKNKSFDAKELLCTTATSAFVSGTVGGVVGAGVYGMTSPATTNSVTETIIKDSASSSTRKILGKIEHSIINPA